MNTEGLALIRCALSESDPAHAINCWSMVKYREVNASGQHPIAFEHITFAEALSLVTGTPAADIEAELATLTQQASE